MLREVRRLAPRGLDAEHVSVDLRTPELRLGVHRGRHVASDYALLARATPFLDRPARSSGLTLVLEGGGRYDEDGRHAWLAPGDLVVNDQSRDGTEAHGGARSRVLLLEWEHDVLGAPVRGAFGVTRLCARDRARIDALASALENDHEPRAPAVARLLDLLRAIGLPFERVSPADLDRHATPPADQAISDAVGRTLSRLDDLPAIDDVGDALSMHSRTLHRRLAAMADAYGFTWAHWRSALHLARVLAALRLLAVPGATTEGVARLTGFRSPVALCHTFAEGGLPSPGVLARAARRDVLAAWVEHAEPLAAE